MPAILVSNARQHTLKNLSCSIPHQTLTVVTGPSGSGKSSLAFDTLYAEAQRRFIESMSTYARQFLARLDKPDVDDIQFLLPAVALEQKNTVRNARSTVGTITEIDDRLRTLFATVGRVRCGQCGGWVAAHTPEDVLASLAAQPNGSRLWLLAPVPWQENQAQQQHQHLVAQGYPRVLQPPAGTDKAPTAVDITAMAPEAVMPEADGHVWAVVDRLTQKASPVDEKSLARRRESVRAGLALGGQRLRVWNQTHNTQEDFWTAYGCPRCLRAETRPTPQHLSFNSALGACPSCEGFGRAIQIAPEKVIPNPQLSLQQRAIHPFSMPGAYELQTALLKDAKKHNIRTSVPYAQLTDAERDFVWHGAPGKAVGRYEGLTAFFDYLESKKYKVHVRVLLSQYREYVACPACAGSRLKPEAQRIEIDGHSLPQLASMPLGQLAAWASQRLPEVLTPSQQGLTARLRQDLSSRLETLMHMGLGYLSLARQMRTLSGGEAQRIHLGTALGNRLTDTLYVLDEPTVGLHARDTRQLLGVLRALRDDGNTLLVVEHDPDVILAADYVLDLGPQGGEAGGQLLYAGDVPGLLASTSAPTAQALRLAEASAADPLPADAAAPPASSKTHEPVIIRGARGNNLRNIDVHFPTDRLVCVTGVSGSGKSTLIKQTLYAGYQHSKGEDLDLERAPCEVLEGLARFSDVVLVDQTPMARSSRSNPATYSKMYDEVRELFGGSNAARMLGRTARDFSFNIPGGRCETCEGLGTLTIDMQFMADVTVVCDACRGKRFTPEVLSVTYQDKTIDDVFQMTVQQAMGFFNRPDKKQEKIRDRLQPLLDLGLGYLRLGQSTATLSGGEAQRLKLAGYLTPVRGQKPYLLLFDEPTTGLHLTDISRLVGVLRRLVAAGNAVVVVEHNLAFIRQADYLLDMGPEGGDGGGWVVASGTVADVMACPDSVTGACLRASA
jgi:excinuclease ABC subunit A